MVVSQHYIYSNLSLPSLTQNLHSCGWKYLVESLKRKREELSKKEEKARGTNKMFFFHSSIHFVFNLQTLLNQNILRNCLKLIQNWIERIAFFHMGRLFIWFFMIARQTQNIIATNTMQLFDLVHGSVDCSSFL